MAQLKTGHILLYNDSSIYGGHERMTLAITRELLLAGTRTTYIFSRDNAPIRRQLAALSAEFPALIQALETKAPRGPIRELSPLWAAKSLLQLSSIIRRSRCEVVLTASGWIGGCSLGIIASVLARKQVVAYLPVARSMAAESRAFGALRDLLARAYARRLSGIITISARERDRFVRLGLKSDRVRVVENFLTPPPPTRALATGRIRSDLGLPPTNFILGVIGRIQFEDKGHDILIDAIRIAAPRLAQTSFVVVGSGPDEQRLRAMIQALPPGPTVTVFPWRDDLEPIYAALDCLVIPSRVEGVPLVMAEAVLRGIPVIAANVGGIPALLPPSWCFPSGRPPALAARLAECRTNWGPKNPHLQQVQAHFQKLFLRTTAGKELLAALGTLCEKHSSSSDATSAGEPTP